VSEPVLGATSWLSAVFDQPIEAVVGFTALTAAAVGAGLALRHVTRRTRSLRNQVLAVTLASLVLGAAAAVVLARLMVLDPGQLSAVAGALAVTAVFATLLVLTASSPLGRDVRRLEATVRSIEAGDRSAHSGVVRADELGHVARALDELTARLDSLERERAGYEAERMAMLSSVGHDLRTPLSALRAAVEALADGIAPEPERYVRAMQRDVEALSALVDDVFLLATIEAGRLELYPQPTDLTEIADEAIEALAPVAAGRDVSLHLDASGRVNVAGNATALGRVIRNLLDNAIRHAPAGSVIQIVVRDDDGAKVRVVDEGPGFPEEFAAHAFERFARADPSRARATGGGGLGLAIARGLIEAHGGRIWIEQPPGGRVTFELPAA
jgi:signal transduction histidine kinase